jgi:hypothetical protein
MKSLSQKYHLRQIADVLSQTDPHEYNQKHVYIYGWSGKLSAQTRREEAKKLYYALTLLRHRYIKTYNVEPRIRLITHSHGGNIALYLPEIKPALDKNFAITELILLACPVQARTMYAIHDALFKRVYSLYSTLDMVQILAPQMFCCSRDVGGKKIGYASKVPLISSRRFLPDAKLSQIKIKVNGHAVFHTFFSSACFMRMLPRVIAEIDSWQKESPQYPNDKPTMRRLLSIRTR